MNCTNYDYTIIGAGIYGMYIARRIALKYTNRKIAVLEYDKKPFQRASYINQARVHNGYHYPRSLSTALKSAGYYQRFIKDYRFAINDKFEKIYAIASNFSYASGENFEKFCQAAGIKCEPIYADKYFKTGMIDRAFVTEECSLDAKKIGDYFMSELDKLDNVDVLCNVRITKVQEKNRKYLLELQDKMVCTESVLNTTYASINQILNLFGFKKLRIKYEMAEICLCNVSSNIMTAGLTVMDGPFFSVMPFGLSGLHSLSAVHFTPHKTSYSKLPSFDCQAKNKKCSHYYLENCNHCPAKPNTAWNEMKQLAMKYINDDIELEYYKSLFAIKPIMKASEISDSRPTIIKEFSSNPRFVSVLSGKFNTMYDLDEVLEW